MCACSHIPFAVVFPEDISAQVKPPVLPDCAVSTYPFVGVFDILRLASSTTLSAMTVAPSAVDVTSPLWLGCV